METPAQRLQKRLKEQFDKFAKTPFIVPSLVALSAGVYYLVAVYASGVCLSPLIPPVVLVGLCWYSGIKGLKKLLIIGVVACLIFSGVYAVTLTDHYQHIQYKTGVSDDAGLTLRNGTLQPLYGDGSTVYRYTVTVHLANKSSSVSEVLLLIQSVRFPSYQVNNLTMTELYRNVTNVTTGEADVVYGYNTKLSQPVNAYVYWANVSGKWYLAATYTGGNPYWLPGPIAKDTLTVLAVLTPYAFSNAFPNTFFAYAIIVLMIWWTRRTRKMREDHMRKWEEDRVKEEAEKPKEETKVKSLQKQAMGLEGRETFVCSECGADVPADATVCPKCGEKFD